MILFADIVMYAWPSIVLMLFVRLQARTAVIAAFLSAWLFLPTASYELPIFPDYTKMSATSCSVLVAVLLFDSRRFTSFRANWLDLPMVIFCVCPLFSSISNGLGVYDGISALLDQAITCGAPYLIGRLYFSDFDSCRELALGILIGAIVYVPFCLFEARMSPQLHYLIYGFSPSSFGFGKTIRFGGWRPFVFMQDGLMVGTWMTAGSLLGVWMWWTNILSQLRTKLVTWSLPLLLITTVLCRSTGALLLFAVGLATLLCCKATKSALPALALGTVPLLYVVLRATGVWSGGNLVDAASVYISPERAQSLDYRLQSEDKLLARASQRRVFGWGAWGRNLQTDESDETQQTITDGLWIITLGKNGVVGLVAWLAFSLIPPTLLLYRVGGANLAHPMTSSAVGISVFILLYTTDCLLNAMENPVFYVCMGAITSLAFSPLARMQRQAEEEVGSHQVKSPRSIFRTMWPPAETIGRRNATSLRSLPMPVTGGTYDESNHYE